MKLVVRMRRTDSEAGTEAGVATLELVIVLPILMFFVLLLFQLGHAMLLRQRATVAVRHVAWTDSLAEEQPSDASLREWIDALSVDVATQDTFEDMFDTDTSDLPAGAEPLADGAKKLLSALPLDFSTKASLDADFEPAAHVLPGEGRLFLESQLFKDVWYTEPDDEGISGFLSGLIDLSPETLLEKVGEIMPGELAKLGEKMKTPQGLLELAVMGPDLAPDPDESEASSGEVEAAFGGVSGGE